MRDALAAYTRDLRRFPALTEAAEDQVRELVRNGNHRARYGLIFGSLRLVCAMARQHSRGNRNHLQDLIGVGNVVLFLASRDYDVDSEYRFGAFLYWRLRSSFFRYFAELHGVSPATYSRLRERGRPLPEYESRDDPNSPPVLLIAAGNPEATAITQEEALIVAALIERLRQQLTELPRRERDIVRATGAKAGDPATNADLRREYNISRAWVQRLRRRYLANLRCALLQVG